MRQHKQESMAYLRMYSRSLLSLSRAPATSNHDIQELILHIIAEKSAWIIPSVLCTASGIRDAMR